MATLRQVRAAVWIDLIGRLGAPQIQTREPIERIRITLNFTKRP